MYNIQESNKDDTETVLNLNERANDLFIKPYAFSGAPFIMYDYDNHQNTTQAIFKFPVAGYVLPAQATKTVFNESELLLVDATDLKEGDTIWIANTLSGDWDIRRVNSLNINSNIYKSFDNTLQISTNTPHGLNTDDYVVITDTNDSIDGIYQVKLTDSTDDLTTFSVDYSGTFDSTNAIGVVSKLNSIRINDIDDLKQLLLQKDLHWGIMCMWITITQNNILTTVYGKCIKNLLIQIIPLENKLLLMKERQMEK